jgi:hypothetical protein
MSRPLGASFDPATYNEGGYQLSPTVRANLQAVDTLVRKAAAIVGAPVIVTSGYRTPEKNSAVDGVSNSQHLDGTAADVIFEGVPLATVAKRLNAAIQRGELEAGQVIYYPAEVDQGNRGHVHLSLPTRTSRNVQLIHTATSYLRLSAENWPAFGVVAVSAGAVILLGLALWLLASSEP